MRASACVLLSLCFFVFASCDTVPRTFTVNLDLSPSQRWPITELLKDYNSTVHEAIGLIGQFIPDWAQSIVEDMALEILPYLGDYAQEIQAMSDASGIPLAKVTLLNIIYEVEAGCTSIIAQDPTGHILHGRNLDFPLTSILRNMTINVEFMKGGSILYHGTTFVGYVGLLTGMRPGGFSITANQRNEGYQWENFLEALFVDGTYATCFLIRDTLEQETNFDSALNRLAYTSLAAPIYLILGGMNADEGAVITRDRSGPADIWILDSEQGRWFEVEANEDHWGPIGNRAKAANAGMTKMGQADVSLPAMFDVLSINPVENSDTTYTAMMSAYYGNYNSTVRSFV